VGPLLGGAVTTFASWRWVFLAETVIVFVILLSVRKIEDAAPEARKGFDVVGALLSIVSLCLIVLAALKSGQWGWIRARSGEPGLLGISAVAWMILGGAAIIAAFVAWERRRARREAEPLVNLALFSNRQVVGGLIQFFFQFLAQAGVFFTIPLFLSVVLGLSALQTGLRLLPLSATLLLAAILIPKFLSKASPRRIVQAGLCSMIAGTVVLIAGVSPGANAGVVAIPMVLMGLGIGALASQLGAITVSGASAEDATDVGGLQNTATNLGASFGTALAGAVLIAHLASSTLSGITSNPQASAQLKTAASTQLSQGVAFVSDAELSTSLKASTLSATDQQVIIDANTQGRIDGLDSALTIIACLEVVALGFTRRLPRRPLADSDSAGEAVV